MKIRGPAAASVVLHACLIVLAVVHLGWTTRVTPWGKDGTGGEATTLTLTEGIPLPPAPVANPLATDTPTLNLPEKAPKPEKKIEPPDPKAIEILDRKSRQKEAQERLRKEMMADLKSLPKSAPNAIPGSGGRAGSEMYKPAASIGSGQVGFGGDFGSRSGWYVDQVRSCLSQSWEQLRSETGARTHAKAQVAFEILKNGSIANVRVTVTSGIPATDHLAVSAVQACSGPDRHLQALPREFEGNKIPVEVAFDRK